MSIQVPQDSSLLFQKLPPELRLDIYSLVFCSTRLSFGKRRVRSEGKRIDICLRPVPNSLSVLRVCCRINDEIGDSWLGQVLFSFEDPRTMLDKLADLDRETLGKLRHMRYSSEYALSLSSTDLFEDGRYGTWSFELPQILKLLRGLRLERLTVLGQSTAQWRYYHLNALINHSDGWKELYYLSSNSVMLGFGKFDKSYGNIEWPLNRGWRAPQPSTWTQALANRDGPTASVTIYRAKDAALGGSMISKPATCQTFVDQVAEPWKESEYGVAQDTALMVPGEKTKEILVVAKRGQGVDYTEYGTSPMIERWNSPMMEHDIRKFWPNMTWGQIRYMGIGWHEEYLGRILNDDDDDDYLFEDIPPEMLPVLARLMRPAIQQHDRPRNDDGAAGIQVNERGYPIIEDSYAHVDDYEWDYVLHTEFSPDLWVAP